LEIKNAQKPPVRHFFFNDFPPPLRQNTGMNASPRILVFAGSLRKDSYNKKLARLAAEALRAAGAEATWIDLADYPMPIYDQDLEDTEGHPEAARRFKALMQEHDGFLIAAPEYNSSITPLLKNALDWASRREHGDEPPLLAFTGKTAALVAASPGGLGGSRGLVTLRSLLGNIGVFLLPEQVTIPDAGNAFDDAGALTDPRKREQLAALAQRLVEFTGSLPFRASPPEA